MSDFFLLSFGVVVFVATMLALTLVYWGWTNRREMRRLQIAHRLGLAIEVPASLRIDRAHEAQPWRWMRDLLDRAGDPEDPRQLALHIGLCALGGVVISMWLLSGPNMLVGLPFGAFPLLLLRRRAAQRNAKLTEQLPDALDRIGRTLRAGHSFSDAFRLAAEELPAPIGDEFARVSETHRLGVDLRTCLDDLASRHRTNFDLRLFVSAVLLHRDTGGNLVEILDHLAETVRERIIFHHKVVSLTAEANVSALILGVLPFLLASILLVLQPAYLVPLVSTDLGRMLLGGAAVSLATGAVAMRSFAAVEV